MLRDATLRSPHGPPLHATSANPSRQQGGGCDGRPAARRGAAQQAATGSDSHVQRTRHPGSPTSPGQQRAGASMGVMRGAGLRVQRGPQAVRTPTAGALPPQAVKFRHHLVVCLTSSSLSVAVTQRPPSAVVTAVDLLLTAVESSTTMVRIDLACSFAALGARTFVTHALPILLASGGPLSLFSRALRPSQSPSQPIVVLSNIADALSELTDHPTVWYIKGSVLSPEDLIRACVSRFRSNLSQCRLILQPAPTTAGCSYA